MESPLYKWPKVFLSLFFFLSLFSASAWAQDVETSTKIKQIEVRLAQIETDIKTILQKEDEIIQKVENLRVWARRN